jgi:hypothetical protein
MFHPIRTFLNIVALVFFIFGIILWMVFLDWGYLAVGLISSALLAWVGRRINF